MLVARRDPPFHVDAQDAAPTHAGAYPATRASRLARFVTTIQLLGSLLAVPVGIASAYTFYRANFSPEISCQNLRSGIVALLDKNVDVATRRALVHRDVEAFERSCGTVDPEAAAAFKTLLAAERTAAAATPVAPKVQQSEKPPKETVRKAEPRPQPAAKQPSTNAVRAVTAPVRQDSAVSDAQWLEAVRQALVNHTPQQSDGAQQQSRAAPATRPMPPDATPPVPATAAPLVSAPAQPPAAAVAPPPVQRQPDVDHPVPPEPIPDPVAQGNADAGKPDEHGRSRIGKWISEIPLLGPVVDNARQ